MIAMVYYYMPWSECLIRCVLHKFKHMCSTFFAFQYLDIYSQIWHLKTHTHTPNKPAASTFEYTFATPDDDIIL